MSAAPARLAAAIAEARLGLKLRRRRLLLGATGVMLAAAMLSAASVIAVGLGGGFNRAVKAADMGDLIVHFDPEPAGQVARRIEALPDIAGYALRTQVNEVSVSYGDHSLNSAIAEVVGDGRRRGYAVVAGHDLRGSAPGVLVEPAFASAWGIRIGTNLDVRGLGDEPVVGYAEGPDDVGYPLASARFYLSAASLRARYGSQVNTRVNFAEIWLRNPSYVNEVLVQARDSSYGLKGVQFATRSGVRLLVHQAAGIVIDLLVALSLIALVTAAVMLGASARAEVQRRMRSIGIRCAIGATRGHIALVQALEAAMLAVPAATIGALAGWAATYGSGNRLLSLLNEPGPGTALALPLIGAWLVAVAIPVAGAAWPAWRAAGGAVISLIRGADVARPGRSLPWSARGLTALGTRLVAARPARLAATVAMLACSTAFVLLMIALATTLSSLETDPQALGKQYQLTASLPPNQAAMVARIPGVAAAEPRYALQAADGYSLGDLVDVVAYPRQTTRFEAPPLVTGSRQHGDDQAEVGVGLAAALGLSPGSQLLLALPSGTQLQLRVSGTVNSLVEEGFVAYVPAAALLAADPSAPSQIAVLLKPGANEAAVIAALTRLGARPATATGATARGAALVDVLKTILLAVAVLDGLVCLYALVQTCGLTVQERRRTLAVLRACGGDIGAVRRLLTGAVLALVAPAAVIGIALERLALGPALSRLAVGYATLELDPTLPEIVATLAGLALAAGAAVVWTSRVALREPVVRGLAA